MAGVAVAEEGDGEEDVVFGVPVNAAAVGAGGEGGAGGGVGQGGAGGGAGGLDAELDDFEKMLLELDGPTAGGAAAAGGNPKP